MDEMRYRQRRKALQTCRITNCQRQGSERKAVCVCVSVCTHMATRYCRSPSTLWSLCPQRDAHKQTTATYSLRQPLRWLSAWAVIYNTLIIGHKSDKCNLSSLRQQQPARGAGQNELRQTESRHVKWRTWCSVLGSDSGRRFVPSAKMKKVLDTKCQLDIFYCTITTRTHTHTHINTGTHTGRARRDSSVRARIETTFSRRLKVCSSS